MLFTESGRAEPGCVFATDFGDRFGREVWVVSHYEPGVKICFVRTGSQRVTRYSIELEPVGERLHLVWQQEMTSLSEGGDRIVDELAPPLFTATMKHLEQYLDYYLRNGRMMENAAAAGG